MALLSPGRRVGLAGACLALLLVAGEARAATSWNLGGGSPSLESPSCGSVLSGAAASFGWSANGSLVEAWWLYVGSRAGAGDYFDSGRLAQATRSAQVPALPTDGRALFVRLFSLRGGQWHYVDCTYTAATVPPPALSAPACGSTLAGTSAMLAWSDNGNAAAAWWLSIGRSAGTADVYDSGRLAADTRQVDVTGLPGAGETLYVRLWHQPPGGTTWRASDCTLTAATLPAPELTEPACGTTLDAASATFSWTDHGQAVAAWWLSVGSSQGANDLHDSGRIGAGARSHAVSGLPGGGETFWVRLWHLPPGGTWRARDCSFTAATLPAPALASPACGATLEGARTTFTWDDSGSTPEAWWLYVGTRAGATDVHDSGRLAGATRSHEVAALPAAGETLHVQLWWRNPGRPWEHRDCTVTAATLPGPELASPACGATLEGPSQRFTWDDPGQGAAAFWLYLGTAPGTNDLYDSGRLGSGARSAEVSGLPVDGSELHAQLWYQERGQWRSRRCTMTAATLAPPAIASPVCGVQLTTSSPTFQWNANGREPDAWWLYVGSTPGANDWFDSGKLAPDLRQVRARGLPYDGQSLHATLFHLERGRWQSSACPLQALTAPRRTVTGTYQGSGFQSCTGSGAFAGLRCGSCTYQGTFDAAFRDVGAEEPPPSGVPRVQGPWVLDANGSAWCPDGYDTVSVSVDPFEVVQRGTTFSGRAYERGGIPILPYYGCNVSCVAPGNCSLTCPSAKVACSVRCTPATWNCDFVYDVTGTVSAGEIRARVSWSQSVTADCGQLGSLQVNESASNDFVGTIR